LNTIPVFIYHETGQKKTFACGFKQSYVKYCIKSAEDYNDLVILLGDQSNIHWCKKGVLASEYENGKWARFKKVFVNLTSDYPDAWAQGFFKRFFLVEEYLKRNDYNECVILDSDILTYINYSELFDGLGIDVAHNTCPKDFSEDYNSSSAHVSYFTYKAIVEFTDYCIEQYENHNRVLWDFYEETIKNKWAGGVTEMGLLYMWLKDHPEVKGLNLLMEKEGAVCDNTFFSNGRDYSGGYNGIRYAADPKYQMKKTIFKDGTPYFIKEDGSLVRAYVIHCGQITKMYMRDYYLHQKLGLMGKTRFWLEQMRAIASGIKRKIKSTDRNK